VQLPRSRRGGMVETRARSRAPLEGNMHVVWSLVRGARREAHKRWRQRVQDTMRRGGEHQAMRVDGENPHVVVSLMESLFRAMTLCDDGSVQWFERRVLGVPIMLCSPPQERVEGPFLAISTYCYGQHSLALRKDGSVQCWGSNLEGEAPPEGVEGPFTAVSCGDHHSLALREDGSVHCWGRNHYGQAPPEGVEGPFTAISAGDGHSLGLREDGSVQCWGWNYHGQAPPEGVKGPFVAIGARTYSSEAYRADGSMHRWGAIEEEER